MNSESTAKDQPVIVTGRQIESYLRVSVEIPGGSVEAGLQRQRGEPMRWLRSELRRVVADASLVLNGDAVGEDNASRLTDELEMALVATWPERAWFLEVWNADEAMSQVYAPWGMPQKR